jgi:hypothetical protein
MNWTWKNLHRQQQKVGMETSLLHPFTYWSLWGAIQTALSTANRDENSRKAGKLPRHKVAQKHATDAAKMAANLAAHLRKDGPLDFLGEELFPFPDDVARLASIGIRDPKLNRAGVSLASTTFVELLIEFRRRAEESAQSQPIVQRVRAKKEARKDARPLTFIRELHRIFFKHRFEHPMHTVIATIANVTLELPPHLELTGEFVRRALSNNRQ